MISVIEQLCKAGHEVHILQKNTGGNLPSIPEKLNCYKVFTDTIPFVAATKNNFVARYLVELNYVRACNKYITRDYDAVFLQSNTVAGYAIKTVRDKLKDAMSKIFFLTMPFIVGV